MQAAEHRNGFPALSPPTCGAFRSGNCLPALLIYEEPSARRLTLTTQRGAAAGSGSLQEFGSPELQASRELLTLGGEGLNKDRRVCPARGQSWVSPQGWGLAGEGGTRTELPFSCQPAAPRAWGCVIGCGACSAPPLLSGTMGACTRAEPGDPPAPRPHTAPWGHCSDRGHHSPPSAPWDLLQGTRRARLCLRPCSHIWPHSQTPAACRHSAIPPRP